MFLVGLLDTSPRPTSAAHALSRLCRLSVREICCTFLSFSAKHPQRACAHTPSPVYSSCIRSLIATCCNNLLFRPSAYPIPPTERPRETLRDPLTPKHTRASETSRNQNKHNQPAFQGKETSKNIAPPPPSLQVSPRYSTNTWSPLLPSSKPAAVANNYDSFCTTRQSLLHLAYLTRTAAHFCKTPFPWIAQASVEELSPC